MILEILACLKRPKNWTTSWTKQGLIEKHRRHQQDSWRPDSHWPPTWGKAWPWRSSPRSSQHTNGVGSKWILSSISFLEFSIKAALEIIIEGRWQAQCSDLTLAAISFPRRTVPGFPSHTHFLTDATFLPRTMDPKGSQRPTYGINLFVSLSLKVSRGKTLLQ